MQHIFLYAANAFFHQAKIMVQHIANIYALGVIKYTKYTLSVWK